MNKFKAMQIIKKHIGHTFYNEECAEKISNPDLTERDTASIGLTLVMYIPNILNYLDQYDVLVQDLYDNWNDAA